MSALASARETPFGEIEIRCPRSQELIDALKEEIPARYREWDGPGLRWLIREPYTTTAIGLLLARFPNATTPATYARPPRVTTKPLPIPPLAVVPRTVIDQTESDVLTARVTCPKCATR